MLCGLESLVDSSRLKVWVTDRLCSRGSTASEGSLQAGQQQANASSQLVWHKCGVLTASQHSAAPVSGVAPGAACEQKLSTFPATTSVMEPSPKMILAAKRICRSLADR